MREILEGVEVYAIWYLSVEYVHELDLCVRRIDALRFLVIYAMNLTSLVSVVAAPALSAFAAWKA
jgi:hypothetical protein